MPAILWSRMKQLSRAIELLGTAVTLILLAGIALVLLKANRTNDIVEAVRDAADWLAGPVQRHVRARARRARSIAVNWGDRRARVLRGLARLAGFVSRRG